ncbi:MAG TPA: YicC family protein [Opitutae bacterium]|nr:YicC family protein [Opitutae bacterium]
MKSMTGFGRSELIEEGVTVYVQISSINRKSLDIMCILPKEFQQLERQVVKKTRNRIGRGRIQFSIEIKDERNELAGLPSDDQIDAGIERLKRITERHDGSIEITPQVVVDLARLQESEANVLPVGVDEQLLMKCADAALDELISMRENEGAALREDIGNRCIVMRNTLNEMGKLAPEMVKKHRENLLGRLEQAGLEIDVEDERVLREMALFADRCDVSEEITRLYSHLGQFSDLLDKADPVGRSMEFLIQEIAREINTIGSKSSSINVSKSALSLKNELERIREQVANVE